MKALRLFVLVTLILSAITGSGSSIVRVASQSDGADLGSVATSLFTGPTSIFIIVVELFLGIGLGYISLKALKYILAFAVLIFLGIFLNVWQAPQLASMMGFNNFIAVSSQVLAFAYSIGLTTVLPLTLGFIVGALVGALK